MNRARSIAVDLKSPVPVYRQVVDAIRHLLVDGVVRPGEQLPTVRQLAVDLGIHFNTVAQAYRELSQEGWLELRRRRGAIVLDRTQPRLPNRAKRQSSLQGLSEITARLRSEGIPANEIAEYLRTLADGIDGTR